jgi:hypothetical protein
MLLEAATVFGPVPASRSLFATTEPLSFDGSHAAVLAAGEIALSIAQLL